jgi:hypothetical protein
MFLVILHCCTGVSKNKYLGSWLAARRLYFTVGRGTDDSFCATKIQRTWHGWGDRICNAGQAVNRRQRCIIDSAMRLVISRLVQLRLGVQGFVYEL